MDRRLLRVGVISGGNSAEAAVSRSSVKEVARALRVSFDNVTEYEFDDELPAKLMSTRPDVVFPVLHGPPGEDGTLQGFLEVIGLPFIGSGVTASACAMNKYIAKQLFRSAGLPVIRDMLVPRVDADFFATARLGRSRKV